MPSFPGDAPPAPSVRAELRLCLTMLLQPDLSRPGERHLLSPEGPTSPDDLGSAVGVPLPRLRIRPDGGVTVQSRTAISQWKLAGLPLDGKRDLRAAELEAGVLLEAPGRALLLLHRVDGTPQPSTTDHGMVGDSDAIRAVRRAIVRAAAVRASVLISGETGTGKELAARAIHDAGSRSDGPYVAINMAALPPSLAAAELFGHTTGAFTGAKGTQRGALRSADRGTLFLDEVNSAPPEVQAMLLRALETGEVKALGADQTTVVDIRVVAACETVAERAPTGGELRSSLRHRLAVMHIEVPPLRERRDDIPRLFFHHFRIALRELGAEALLDRPGPLPAGAVPTGYMASLMRRRWSGNVRELVNEARRRAVLCWERGALTFPLETGASSHAAPPEMVVRTTLEPQRRRPRHISEKELIAALQAAGWRRASAAAALGISRSSLYNLISRSPGVRRLKDISAVELTGCHERQQGNVERMAAELQVSPHAVRLRMAELDVKPGG